ncbi:uncharacterized protein NPIL_14011 [Nephila pilipes]|uniref:Uncharacterized protein n=1 Tax=Nephila pilipes TaxID=299642 RepID=A0A8X6M8G4_NEPPI|nr:uncharacterized protein NPIL_14011 [Nephila pilipes]
MTDTVQPFDEIIPDSESSDINDAKMTYFGIGSKYFDSDVISPEMPLLHNIPTKGEMKSGMNNDAKTLSSIRDVNASSELSGNHEMDEYSELQKNISCGNLVDICNDQINIDSYVINDLTVDSTALIDDNLIKNLIYKLNKEVPCSQKSESNFKNCIYGHLNELQTEKNTIIQNFVNDNKINDKVEETCDTKISNDESDTVALKDEIVREYSQNSLRQHISYSEDNFDCSQPLFLSSSSQKTLLSDHAYDVISIQNTHSSLHFDSDHNFKNISYSQDLFEAPLSSTKNREDNIDIWNSENKHAKDTSFKDSKNIRSKFLEKDSDVTIYEDQCMTDRKHEVLVDKNTSHSVKQDLAPISCSELALSGASIITILKEKRSNDNYDLSKEENKLAWGNECNDTCQINNLMKSDTCSELNSRICKNPQDSFNCNTSLDTNQKDEFIENLDEMCSCSPSLLDKCDKTQRTDDVDRNKKISDLTLECFTNKFDYVKNIRVIRNPIIKTDLKNKAEIVTEFADIRSDETTNSCMDSDHIGMTDSLQSKKEENSIKNFFKTKSTRCLIRFQTPWATTDMNEENCKALKKQGKKTFLENNVQVDNTEIRFDSNTESEDKEKSKQSFYLKFNHDEKKNTKNCEEHVEHASKSDLGANQTVESETNLMNNNCGEEQHVQIILANDLKDPEKKVSTENNKLLLSKKNGDTSDFNYEIIKVSNEDLKKTENHIHVSHPREIVRVECSKNQNEFSDAEQNKNSNQSTAISLLQATSTVNYNEKENSMLKLPRFNLNDYHNDTTVFRKRKRYNTRAQSLELEKNNGNFLDNAEFEKKFQAIEEFNSNNDIEILKEYLDKKGRKTSRKRRKSNEMLNHKAISLTGNKKCKQKQKEMPLDRNNHQGTMKKYSIPEKEQFLLEKIETKLYKIASVLKDRRFSTANKNHALELLQKMRPILQKTEQYCSNIKTKYQTDYSNEILILSKLKYLRFLHDSLLSETDNFPKSEKQKFNKEYCSEFMHNSFSNTIRNKPGLSKPLQRNTLSILADSKMQKADNSIISNPQKVDSITRKKVIKSNANFREIQSSTGQSRKLRSVNTSDSIYNSCVTFQRTINIGDAHEKSTNSNGDLQVMKFERDGKNTKKRSDYYNGKSEAKICHVQSQNINNYSKTMAFENNNGKQKEQEIEEIFSESIRSIEQYNQNESHCCSFESARMEINSSDETQSLEDLNKDLQAIPTEKENEEKITKPLVEECSNITVEKVPVVLKFTESADCESLSLLENTTKKRKRKNKMHKEIPIPSATNVICRNNINSKLFKSPENNCVSNNEMISQNCNNAISKSICSNAANSSTSIVTIETNETSAEENAELNSYNNKNNFHKEIDDEFLIDKQPDNIETNFTKETINQPYCFTNDNNHSEKDICDFVNMDNSKISETQHGLKKSLKIVECNNVNSDTSNKYISSSTAFSKNFNDTNLLDAQDQIKNGSAEYIFSKNKCLDQFINKRYSNLLKQQNSLHCNAHDSASCITEGNPDKNFHLNPINNISICNTYSKKNTDEKKKITSNQTAKNRKAVSLRELIQCSLLQTGVNVLSIHMPEGIIFGSLDNTGRITSNGKSYNTLLQWCCDLPNFFPTAQKSSKSKYCYDRIYNQGHTLSYFANIYHQGLVNWNAPLETEESSIMLGSSTGLEVIQRSIAPERDSFVTPVSPISDPVILNLLKMKLLLIGDNEVGPIAETDQWDDIDKWD